MNELRAILEKLCSNAYERNIVDRQGIFDDTALIDEAEKKIRELFSK